MGFSRWLRVIASTGMMAGLALSAGAASKARWTKVATPHLTILTQDSPRLAQEWAACLEAFREDLQRVAPTDDRMLEPLTLIVFKDKRAYRAAAMPNEKEDFYTISTSRFTSHNGRFLGMINPEEEEGARHAVFLQAGIWLTDSYRWPLPLWMVTGLQEVYSEYSLDGERVSIGGAVEGSAQSLANGLRMPLEQMFGMTTQSPTYQAKDGYFNAQAWAFVHFLLLGDKGANRPLLEHYMAAIQRGDDAQASLRLLAPEGMAALSARFTRYVRQGSYASTRLPADLAALSTRVVTGPAPDADVQLALGYFYLSVKGDVVAAPYFAQANQLAPGSVAVLEGLGALAGARGDAVEEARCDQAAVAAGSTFYITHFYAFLPSVAPLVGGEAAEDNIEPATARQAVSEVKRMLRLRPAFQPGHETLALLIGSLSAVEPDDEALLLEGARAFPDDAVMEAGCAAYEIAKRRFVAAKARLDRIDDGQMANARRVAGYAQKLRQRLAAANGFYWLEKFYAENNRENVEKLLASLKTPQLLPAERERFQVIQTAVGARDLLEMAQQAAGRQDWEAAGALLGQVEDMKPPPEVAKDAATLRATLNAHPAAK